MLATLLRHSTPLVFFSSSAVACGGNDEDTALWVQLDGKRFVPTHVNSALFSEGAETSRPRALRARA